MKKIYLLYCWTYCDVTGWSDQWVDSVWDDVELAKYEARALLEINNAVRIVRVIEQTLNFSGGGENVWDAENQKVVYEGELVVKD